MEKNYYKGAPKIKSVKGTRYARVRNYASFIFVTFATVCGVGFHYSSFAEQLRQRYRKAGYFEPDEEQILRSFQIWSTIVNKHERVDTDGFPLEEPNPRM